MSTASVQILSSSVLFFNPNDNQETTACDRSSPASDDSFEHVERDNSPRFRSWPIIQPPELSVSETFSTPYSDLIKGPIMPVVSLTNLALQYIFNLRDFILSLDSTTLHGETKLGLITFLSFSTAIGYTVMTIEEAFVRFNAAIVAIALSALFALIAIVFSGDRWVESEWFTPFGIATTFAAAGLWGGIQCLTQITTGIFAAIEMMTNTNPHMPKVSTLTNEATFGLQDWAIGYLYVQPNTNL